MKKILSILVAIIILAVALPVLPTSVISASATEVTVYVSPLTGNDTNNGLTESTPFATFPVAYKSTAADKLTIVILDKVTLENAFVFAGSKATTTIITGKTPDTVLDITAKNAMGMYDNVVFDDLTLDLKENTVFCAGGKNVTLGEGLTITNRIKAFGGGYNSNVTGDTNFTILSGNYVSIYGGGCGSNVDGNTNITIGGNVNIDDGIDDTADNISPCYIYGGCYNGIVSGTATINFKDNAVAKYISGSGYSATDTVAGDTYINITGGKVMNVYGGSLSTPVEHNTFVTVTGGLVESVFGGCESTSMTGNAVVHIGGTANISRRVYGGCYNNWSITWKSDNYVKGSTTIIIEEGCNLASGTELAAGNSMNSGVFAGSRTNKNKDDEINTVIYYSNANETLSAYKLGDRSGYGTIFKSHTDFIVHSGEGGKVTAGATPGYITIIPDLGYAGKILEDCYLKATDIKLLLDVTDVSFEKALCIKYDPGVYGNTIPDDYMVSNRFLTLPATVPANTSAMTFIGWSKTNGSNTADYEPGEEYLVTEAVTFYAVWIPTAVNYKVCHYVESHLAPQSELFKTEYLSASYGSLTVAKALDMLGYTSSSFSQMTVMSDGTTISIYYKKGDSKTGDVNCDGTIDMLDIAILQRYLAEWNDYGYNAACLYSSDCNKDGKLTISDALLLMDELAGNDTISDGSNGNTEDDWGPWV